MWVICILNIISLKVTLHELCIQVRPLVTPNDLGPPQKTKGMHPFSMGHPLTKNETAQVYLS